MVCEKCGYKDKKEIKKFDINLCRICNHFSPNNRGHFEEYIKEKIDWKIIDTFRKYNQSSGEKLKLGMEKRARQGKIVTRAPLGYDITGGKLIPNRDSSKVHSLFRKFLEENHSLNFLAKQYNLSVNGIKKILSNRTYLGEIKFAGRLSKGKHQQLISPEIFYAVQRKLNNK